MKWAHQHPSYVHLSNFLMAAILFIAIILPVFEARCAKKNTSGPNFAWLPHFDQWPIEYHHKKNGCLQLLSQAGPTYTEYLVYAIDNSTACNSSCQSCCHQSKKRQKYVRGKLKTESKDWWQLKRAIKILWNLEGVDNREEGTSRRYGSFSKVRASWLAFRYADTSLKKKIRYAKLNIQLEQIN